MNDDSGKYDDMLDLPHHVSKRHPQMPMRKRASQFAPFAALTGYSEAIREAEKQAQAQFTPSCPHPEDS